MTKSLEGYWEGEDNDPSDAITEIVIKMEKAVNLPGDLSERDVVISGFEYSLDDGTVVRKRSIQRRGNGNFHFTACFRGYGCYSVAGTVSRKGKKWTAGAEAEVVEY